jgi:hypothetical protein
MVMNDEDDMYCEICGSNTHCTDTHDLVDDMTDIFE